MKAIVLTKFGPPDVLQLQEVAKPTPKDHQVLVRIHATTVSAAECEIRSLRLPLAFKLPIWFYFSHIGPKPIILGQELAGEIEAIGKDVTRFKVGDRVTAWCSISLGAYAEYRCLSEKGVLAIKPSNMTYEEAATLPIGGLEAAYFIRNANIKPGERVLINGAGGSIGTYAVQLAHHLGAEVTGVDSAEKLDMLRSLGATHVVDYKKEDFTRRGKTYDVIIDVIGRSPYFGSIRSLSSSGRYLFSNPRLTYRVLGRLLTGRSGKQVVPWANRSSAEYQDDFNFLRELIEAGKIRAIIDRSYPLEKMVEAHRYADSGRKQGSIAVTVAQGS